MKKYAVSTVVVLVVLALVMVSFGQQQATRQGGQGQGQSRGGFMSSEERAKAIEAIEAQLAKLKASSQGTGNRESFQNMSEDERAKVMEKFQQARDERNKALQIIMAQVAAIQGRREPAPEGAQYLIVATTDLKPIQDAAVKEKATETAKLLEGLAARGSSRGFGGGRRTGSSSGGEGTRTRSGNANR
jgi:hypothetical protein